MRGKNSFLLTALICAFSISLCAQSSIITVADGVITNENIPISGENISSLPQNQVIYPASMLDGLTGTTITAITFYLSGSPNLAWDCPFQFRIGTTTTTSFPDMAMDNALLDESFTTVYDGNISINNNQLTINLTTPYPYNGGNMVIDIHNTDEGNNAIASFYGISTNNYASAVHILYFGTLSYTVGQQFIPKTSFTTTTETVCVHPNDVYFYEVGTQSASMTWSSFGDATAWEVYCDTGSVNFEQITWETTSIPYFTFTDLEANTHYTAYVRSVCGSEHSPVFSISFNTHCEAYAIPFHEGFEDDWIPYIAFDQNNNAPRCWTVFNGSGDVSDTIFSNSNHRWIHNTTDAGKIHTGQGSAVCYTDLATTSHNDWLISPPLALSGNQQLSFYVQRGTNGTNEDPDEISVWISDEDLALTPPASDSAALTGFTQLFQTLVPTGGFQLYTLSLANYSGNRRIAFVRRNEPIDGYYLCLDDVSVTEIPPCERPTNLHATATSTHAVLSWSSNAHNFYLYYKTTSDTAFTAAEDHPIGDTTYTIAISPGLVYEWYVDAMCDDGVILSPIEHASFASSCASAFSVPQTWDFEDAWTPSNTFGQENNAPLCWHVYNGGVVNTNNTWKWRYINSSNNAHSGNGSAGCFTDNASGKHNDWLITPMIELTGSQQLSFYARNYSATTNETDEISIWISEPDITLTAPSTDTAALPGFTEIFQSGIPVGPYRLFELPLTGYSGNRHIAFVRRYTPNNGWYLRIDDVTIDEAPSCTRPFMLSATTDSTQAVLSWNSTANSFNLFYRSAGSAEYTALEANPIHDTTYTLSDLLPGTLYEWYVVAFCDDTTALSSLSATFSTECAAISTVPRSWDFESNNTGGTSSNPLPACWDRLSNNTYPYSYNNSNQSYQGTRCLFSGANPNGCTAILPIINTVVLPINTLKLRFFAKYYCTSNIETGTIEIGVMTNPNDSSSFVTVDTVSLHNGLSSTYNEFEVPLNAYDGNGQHIAIRFIASTNAPGNAYLYIDNLHIEPASNCLRPANVTLSNLNANEVTISWTPTGALSWEIIYGPTGFNIDENISQTQTTTINSITFDNLDGNTTYDLYIRGVCGGDNFSSWTSVLTFTTECSSIVATDENEYLETFSNEPDCWNFGDWSYSANSQYLFHDYSSDYYEAITPFFDISAITRPYLRFSHKRPTYSGGVCDHLSVYYRNSRVGEWQLLNTYTDIYPNWRTDSLPLPFASTDYQLKFAIQGDDNGDGSYIDDINIYNNVYAPLCPAPIDVAVDNITPHTAEISIQTNFLNNQYRLYYASNSQNDSIDIQTTSHTLVGLNENSEYTISVAAICDNGTLSDTVTTSFLTTCVPVTEFPYTESFEDGLECWRNVVVSGNSSWSTVTEYTPDALIPDGSYCALAFNNSSGINVTRLFSPTFDLSTLSEPYVSFQHIHTAYYTNQDELRIYYKSSSATEPVLLVSYNNDISDWDEETIALPNTSSSFQLIFEAHLNEGYGVALDMISIYDNIGDTVITDTCHTPSNLTVSNISQTTASINWTAEGDEDSWQVGHKTQNDSEWQEVTVTTTSYNLEGLTANSTYEVRVKAVCSADNESDFITTTFTTQGVGIYNITLANSIILMPNPADNHIDLYVNSNVEVKEAVVFNAFGQMIQTVQLTENHAHIDLSDIAAGMYFVRVNGEDGNTATKKFIKK